VSLPHGEIMIRKVVITAAGIGTRLLTVTKEQPKEMLPLFTKSNGGNLCVKPLLQMVFEQLYDYGFREFCFIIGRGKRVIEDHFTIDRDFIRQLNDKAKYSLASTLEQFYRKIEDSMIVWINQPEPKGFGHAVLMAKAFIGNESFLVHAGDTYIISKNNNHVKRLIEVHEKKKAEVTLLLKEVENPKQYGVAEVQEQNSGVFIVRKVIEKPQKPPTNLAIMPIYIFNPTIMTILEKTQPILGGEIQLTDGIQKIIDKGLKVQAMKLKDDEIRLDVGTPETYWEAIAISHTHSQGQIKHTKTK
jgi:UTP--glucose-1-phosphate uridylyltransferase